MEGFVHASNFTVSALGLASLCVSSKTLQILESNLYYENIDNEDFHDGVFKPRAVLPRASNSTGIVIPDTKTWRSTALIYLFISRKYPSSQLSTSCTKAVLSTSVKFEAATRAH